MKSLKLISLFSCLVIAGFSQGALAKFAAKVPSTVIKVIGKNMETLPYQAIKVIAQYQTNPRFCFTQPFGIPGTCYETKGLAGGYSFIDPTSGIAEIPEFNFIVEKGTVRLPQYRIQFATLFPCRDIDGSERYLYSFRWVQILDMSPEVLKTRFQDDGKNKVLGEIVAANATEMAELPQTIFVRINLNREELEQEYQLELKHPNAKQHCAAGIIP